VDRCSIARAGSVHAVVAGTCAAVRRDHPSRMKTAQPRPGSLDAGETAEQVRVRRHRGGHRWWSVNPSLGHDVVSTTAEAGVDAAVVGLRPGLDGAVCADGLLGPAGRAVVRPGAPACTRALVATARAERRVDTGLLRRPPNRWQRATDHCSSARGCRHGGSKRARRPSGRPALRALSRVVDVCGRAQRRDLAPQPRVTGADTPRRRRAKRISPAPAGGNDVRTARLFAARVVGYHGRALRALSDRPDVVCRYRGEIPDVGSSEGLRPREHLPA
jgi:hypothetical protein